MCLSRWLLPALIPATAAPSPAITVQSYRITQLTHQIGFIGHSQGNGLAFISLSLGMCPNLGKKLSCFIALAPAVYAGPLTTGFPFTALNRLEWSTWKRFFGVLDFIPLMRWAYDWAPAKLFVSLIPMVYPSSPFCRALKRSRSVECRCLRSIPSACSVRCSSHPAN